MKHAIFGSLLAIAALSAHAGEPPVSPIVPGDLTVGHYIDSTEDDQASSNLEVLHYAKGVADAYIYTAIKDGVPHICPKKSRVSWQMLDLALQAEIRRLDLYEGQNLIQIRRRPLTEFILDMLIRHYSCEVYE